MAEYDDMTRAEIVFAIRDLEDKINLGVASVSQPTQGSIGYRSLEDARTILRLLRAQRDVLDGIKTTRYGPKLFKQRISGGWL